VRSNAVFQQIVDGLEQNQTVTGLEVTYDHDSCPLDVPALLLSTPSLSLSIVSLRGVHLEGSEDGCLRRLLRCRGGGYRRLWQALARASSVKVFTLTKSHYHQLVYTGELAWFLGQDHSVETLQLLGIDFRATFHRPVPVTSALTCLELEHCRVDPLHFLPNLAASLRDSAVTKLRIAGTNKIADLTCLTICQNLKTLRLDRNDIGDPGALQLATLFTHLETLDVSFNSVRGSGLRALLAAPFLRSLVCHGMKIPLDEMTQILVEMLPTVQLRHLQVSSIYKASNVVEDVSYVAMVFGDEWPKAAVAGLHQILRALETNQILLSFGAGGTWFPDKASRDIIHATIGTR
jgi:Leucine Rich repeat